MSKMKSILCLVMAVAMIFSGMFIPATNVYAATVNSYALPSIYSPSTAYSLKVAGVDIPVVDYVGEYDYAELSLSGGAATVEVTALGASSISSYNISPKKLGLTGTTSGGRLTFTINKDEYLIVQINSLKKLIIAVDPAETDKPASSGTGMFNVKTDYHADSTGATKTSDAIQAAIDAASAYGTALNNGTQGVVYVPAGVYRVGNLVLKSNVKLYLEGGAVLRATDNPDDYIDHWYKTSQGRWVTWFIYTQENADNVKIYGRGTIDANGYYLANQASPRKLGTNLLVPVNCSNFVVDGITFRDAGSWGIITARSHDLTFTNMKIFNHLNTGEDDGIDVCESQNVLVQNAIAVALDDPFSTKSWTSYDFTEPTNISLNWHGEPQPVQNVTFDDCISWTYCYGFKVGQGVRQVHDNVTFRNSVVFDSSAGIGMEHKYGKAEVRNITFENIDIEQVNNANGQIATWAAFEINNGLGEGGGPVSNVKLKNITVRAKGKNDGRIKGLSDTSSINGFTLENIYMLGNAQPAATLEEMNITHVEYANGITILPHQATSKIQAEYNNTRATITQASTTDDGGGSIVRGPNGSWLAYNNVDFGTGVSSVDLRLAPTLAGSTIELRLDSKDGALIGTANLATTSAFTTMSVPVTNAKGIHTLYLVMKKLDTTANIADINWIDIRYTKAEAENYNEMSGITAQSNSSASNGQFISDGNQGDWVAYNNIDFGSGTSSMNLKVASGGNGGSIELRLGSVDGTFIGTANVENTGGWENWITRNVLLTGASGIQKLYLVFKGPDAQPIVNVDQISFIKNNANNELKIPTAITIDRTSANLDLRQTFALNVAFTPADTNFKDIEWSVVSESVPNVVTVNSNGHVTAQTTGTATVRATSVTNPSVFADCNISVSNTPIQIVSAQPVSVSTIRGVAPVLPSYVTATASNGIPSIYPVTWERVSPEKYAVIGTFEVNGLVDNTSVAAKANVSVAYAPTPTGVSLKYECDADFVGVETSSTAVVFKQGNSGVDANASNGLLGYAKFLAVGDWVEFTINVPAAGKYNVNLQVKKHAGKGIGQLYIDGVKQGAPIDEYYDGNLFVGVDLGSVVFDTAGEKKFRLVSTGKNPLNTVAASSLPYTMTADLIQLTPASELVMNQSVATLNKGETVSPQIIFSNIDTNSRNLDWSVFSESAPNVVSVNSTGTITALNPGTAVVRASSMVYDLHADFNVSVGEPVVTGINSVSITTVVGKAPQLPTVVTAVYSDTTQVQSAVVWNSIDPAQYAQVGSFTVLGTIGGTTIPATATVTVDYASLPATKKYEFESIPVTSSGPIISYGNSETGSSGKTTFLGGTVTTGDWIQFEVDVPSAGIYNITFAYKKRTQNGIYELYINENTTPQGNKAVNLSTGTSTFNTVDMGNVVFDTPGKMLFRFKCAGAGTAGGTNYVFCGDYVTLTPKYTFTIDKASASVVQGLTTALNPVFTGISEDCRSVVWTVQSQSAPNVATVSNTGVVTGVNPGIAVIRATSTVYNNFYTESTVTVQAPIITELQQENVTTFAGIAPEMPSTVNAVYNNNTTAQVKVVWDVIDSSMYASAGSYVIFGAVGGTSIPAVANLTVEPIRIALNPSELPLMVGQNATLNATVNTPNYTVTWFVYSESTSNVVKVNQNGIVTAMNPGTAIVRATSTVSASVYADCTVTVKAAPQFPFIVSVKSETVTTQVGKEPKLPTVVTAVYSDHSEAVRVVIWDCIAEEQYAQVGEFTVSGTVTGTDIPATARIIVEEAPPEVPIIVSIQRVDVKTIVGNAPVLPTVVTAVYSDNTESICSVVWDSINPTKYAQIGSFTVSGTVEGTSLPAEATVTVESERKGGTNDNNTVPPVEQPTDTAKVDVKAEDLNAAIENAKGNTIIIDAQPVKETGEVVVNIPAQELLNLNDKKIKELEVNTGLATITVPTEILKDAIQTGSAKLELSVTKVDAEGLAEEVKKAVGNNPVYDFTLSVDGKKISSFGGHKVDVEVTYTLKAGESANKVVVYYITDSGKLEVVTNGRYNAKTGKVEFSVKHFSKYAAGYADVAFNDIGNVAWAKESIEALAVRKVVDGIGNNAYDPDNKVTRAQFIKLLMKALELVDGKAESSLSDVKPGEWYYDSIAAAQMLGIVVGKEDGSFGVDDEISRQDMAVMVYRAAKLVNKDSVNQTVGITEFTDNSEIADYAIDPVAYMQKVGFILGDNGKFQPKNNATRAEAAVVIYRLFDFVK